MTSELVIEHGTHYGYVKCLARYGQACDQCRGFKADYRRGRGEDDRRYLAYTRGVVVPKLILAEMYLSIPAELQERVEKELGEKRLTKLVELFDAQEVSA